jgi:hypothetical protein
VSLWFVRVLTAGYCCCAYGGTDDAEKERMSNHITTTIRQNHPITPPSIHQSSSHPHPNLSRQYVECRSNMRGCVNSWISLLQNGYACAMSVLSIYYGRWFGYVYISCVIVPACLIVGFSLVELFVCGLEGSGVVDC